MQRKQFTRASHCLLLGDRALPPRTIDMNTLMRRNSGNLLAYALLFALAIIACFASLIR